MAVKQPEPESSVVLTGSASRTLIRRLGPTAWAVLQDVSLDTRREDDLSVAHTSVRRVAGHLGLTPGTVARSLARLCAAGLLHREDRRDAGSGRFLASIYVVVPTRAISPCADLPYTVEPDTQFHRRGDRLLGDHCRLASFLFGERVVTGGVGVLGLVAPPPHPVE